MKGKKRVHCAAPHCKTYNYLDAGVVEWFCGRHRDGELNEDAITSRIDQVLHAAKHLTKSEDPLVHICWLIDGLDIYHRSGGKRGHSLDQTKAYVVSSTIRRVVNN